MGAVLWQRRERTRAIALEHAMPLELPAGGAQEVTLACRDHAGRREPEAPPDLAMDTSEQCLELCSLGALCNDEDCQRIDTILVVPVDEQRHVVTDLLVLGDFEEFLTGPGYKLLA